MTRSTTTVLLAFCTIVCVAMPLSAQSAPPPLAWPEKLATILRLENQRSLRDPAPPPLPPPPPPAPKRRGKASPPLPPPPPPPPDLIAMLSDPEGRVRRRAALAVGRVRHSEGVAPLSALLKDPEPEVRQMAAFAIGLIGDTSGIAPLVAALSDQSPLVQGSAAEGLGLIGDVSAVAPLSRLASDLIAGNALSPVPDDSADSVRDTKAAALRLALYALVRLKSYDGVATVLDAEGRPRAAWWPIAFALQRLEDPRALNALVSLAGDPHPYTRAFAAKGLGAMKDPVAVAPLLTLLSAPENTVVIEAVRALGRLRADRAAPAVSRLIQTKDVDPHVRLEAVGVIGAIGGSTVADLLTDLLGDRSPSVRAAALTSLRQIDAETFMTILSGLDVDDDWTVRAALATVLGTLTGDAGLPRLRLMLEDSDPRVVPSVLAALAKRKPSDLGPLLTTRLAADDPVIRSAAAQAIAESKPAGVEPQLVAAYQRGQSDATYVARAAALAALAAYGPAASTPTLTVALEDKDWAVRVRAASLLESFMPAGAAKPDLGRAPIRDAALLSSPRLLEPPFSIAAYVETTRGTITLELAMLDAPLTVENFVTLARSGFFNGMKIHRVVPDFVVQAGDPRGDGEGSSGYTIRDELNQRPYLRGTVGMALDWRDTGGSQFFITHTPQPHLDAKYTVFGRVLSGMDVVDRIEPWDVIQQVKVWDGIAAN